MDYGWGLIDEGRGELREDEEGEEDLMQQDIGDLLGLQGEEPRGAGLNGEAKKKRIKKKKALQKEAPLISFDEDTVTTPIPAYSAIEESPRARRKGTRTGGGGGGYGSTGYGSTTKTNAASVRTETKASDWSAGDWGEEWSGGHGKSSDTSGSKSVGGWDDWNADGWSSEGGWSTVDLKKD